MCDSHSWGEGHGQQRDSDLQPEINFLLLWIRQFGYNQVSSKGKKQAYLKPILEKR